jgi:Spy/CpxP family protein refolding chaperone
MRKSIVIGALALGLTAGGAALTSSQDLFAHGKGFKAERAERQQKHLDRLSEKLNLTADQKAKIQSLFDAQRAKMKALRDETHTKMLALLTADQKAELEKLREQKGKKD